MALREGRAPRIVVLAPHHVLSPRVVEEVNSLARQHDVHIVCWNRSAAALPPTGMRAAIHEVKLRAPTGSLALAFWLPRLYLRIVREATSLRPVEAVHCTHMSLLPIAIWVARTSGAAVVYDVYERHVISMSERFLRPLRSVARCALELLEHWLVRKTDLVLTVDSPKDELVRRYRGLGVPSEVLFNVPVIHELPERASSDADPRPFRMIYVGGLMRLKGLLVSGQVLVMLSSWGYDVELALVGTRDDSWDEFEAIVREGGVEGRVVSAGWCPYEEMLRMVAAADLGLALHQPRRDFLHVSKGTGRKFFTYMEAGVPIVGPVLGEVGDIVRETGCGVLVDTTSPGEVAGAIKGLIHDPEARARMGAAGRKAIVERYNWSNEEPKLLNGYEAILERRVRRSSERRAF